MTYEDFPQGESPLGETPIAGDDTFDPPTLDSATGSPTVIVWQGGLPRFEVAVTWTPPDDFPEATLTHGSVNDIAGTMFSAGASPSDLRVPLYEDDGNNVYVAQWSFGIGPTVYPIEIHRRPAEWERTDEWATRATNTVTLDLNPAIPVVGSLQPVDNATVSTTQPTISWTPTFDTQHGFRVVVTDQVDVVWYDSGPITSTNPSHEVESTLRHGTEYTVQVQMFGDGGGISAPVSNTFLVDTKDPTLHTPNPDVGTVYEVGINGVGYMLDDDPEEQPYVSATQSLQADKLATGSEAFNNQIERYNFVGYDSWEDGAGLEFRDREAASTKAFNSSLGVDVFTDPARITPVPDSEAPPFVHGSNIVEILSVSANGRELAFRKTIGGAANDTWGRFDPNTAASQVEEVFEGVHEIATDGLNVYATDLATVRKLSDTGTFSEYSAVNTRNIMWLGDRLCFTNGADFSSLAPDGTNEGPHVQFGAGHNLVLGGEVGGFVFFGVDGLDRGWIYSWQLGLDGDGQFHVPTVAMEFPRGTTPVTVHSAGSAVWALCQTGTHTVLYRCEHDGAGKLFPFVVVDERDETLGSVSETVANISDYGDFVYFSLAEGGLGVASLQTGGWSRFVPDTAPIATMATSRRRLFWVDDVGSLLRLSTAGTIVATPEIVLSEIDAGSLVDKVWDEVNLRTDPLGANDELQVDYSVDGGTTWVTGAILEGQGRTFHTIKTAVQSTRIRLRILFLAGAAKVDRVHVRYHMLGLAEKIIQIPIRAYDTQTDLRGKPLPESRPGLAAQQIRDLEQLTQTRVLFQDVDWHLTGQEEVFDVLSVEPRRVLTYNPAKGSQGVGATVIVTMRRGVTD